MADPWDSKKMTDESSQRASALRAAASKRLDPSEKVANGEFVYADIYRWSPGDCPEKDDEPFRNSGMAVLRRLSALDEQAKKLDEQKFLSAEGAGKMLEPLRERVLAEVAAQQRVVAVAAAQLRADEARLFSPGEPDPNDAERRAWYEALSDAARAEFEGQARAGGHVEIVKALARSPVPGRALAFGRAAWRADVETKKAAQVRALEARRRSFAWTEGVLNVAPRVATRDPWSDKRVESPIEKINRARAYRQNPPPRHPRTA